MQGIYTTYKCGPCKREMVLLTKEVNEAIKSGRYLACVYCGRKHIKNIKETNSIKECFKNDEKAR